MASRAKPGETANGDRILLREGDGEVLVAVVDGLGHGSKAAEASKIACDYISGHAAEPLTQLMQGLHAETSRSRGAAVTLLRVCKDRETMLHAAVGNVEVSTLSRARIRPLCIPGIVGCSMRKVVENRFPIASGDIVVIHTDGISRRFDLERYRTLPAQRIAEAIIADWGKSHDDASCVSICF